MNWWHFREVIIMMMIMQQLYEECVVIYSIQCIYLLFLLRAFFVCLAPAKAMHDDVDFGVSAPKNHPITFPYALSPSRAGAGLGPVAIEFLVISSVSYHEE